MADTLGMTINLYNASQPVTQYSNHPFNSIALGPNGEMLAAGDDGIHRLWTEDDDNGSKIISRIDTHLMDFGTKDFKRIPAVFVEGEGDGGLQIEAFWNETESRKVMTDLLDDDECGLRVSLGMEKGKYWKFIITNPGGEDFLIDVFDALLVPLER